MSEEEKKAIANFKYWIDTNTEKGVCYLPDYICAKVLNLIEKTLKENEHLHKEINRRIKLKIENEKIVDTQFIYKQKIKDKIEEYKNMLKTCNKAKDIDRIKAINERILELQELIEGEK